MKIIYKDNDATKVPVHISGKCIQVRQWLRGEQYVPFLKKVFTFNSDITTEEDEQLTLEKRRAEAEDADRSELEELTGDED